MTNLGKFVSLRNPAPPHSSIKHLANLKVSSKTRHSGLKEHGIDKDNNSPRAYDDSGGREGSGAGNVLVGTPAFNQQPLTSVDAQEVSWANQLAGISAGPTLRATHMDGDSYPDTTSGMLTEDEDITQKSAYQSQPLPMQHGQSPVEQNVQIPDAIHEQLDVALFTRVPEVNEQPFVFSARSLPPSRLTTQQLNKADTQHDDVVSMVQNSIPATIPPVRMLSKQSSGRKHRRREHDRHPPNVHDQQPVNQQNGGGSVDGDMSQLDYELHALHAMDYASLKAQSFDMDPRSPAEPSTLPVGEQLEKAVEHSDETGAGFTDVLAHMTTTQWEESGQWIVQEFSQAAAELTRLRKAKRDATKSFEYEIEQRYNDITSKQGIVEKSVRDMRNRGLDMLGAGEGSQAR